MRTTPAWALATEPGVKPRYGLNACIAYFIVKDANGVGVAHVYYEEEPGRRTAANLLTRDEARRIAANIVKLPELSQPPQAAMA
jgi:hypothetical protein